LGGRTARQVTRLRAAHLVCGRRDRPVDRSLTCDVEGAPRVPPRTSSPAAGLCTGTARPLPQAAGRGPQDRSVATPCRSRGRGSRELRGTVVLGGGSRSVPPRAGDLHQQGHGSVG